MIRTTGFEYRIQYYDLSVKISPVKADYPKLILLILYHTGVYNNIRGMKEE